MEPGNCTQDTGARRTPSEFPSRPCLELLPPSPRSSGDSASRSDASTNRQPPLHDGTDAGIIAPRLGKWPNRALLSQTDRSGAMGGVVVTTPWQTHQSLPAACVFHIAGAAPAAAAMRAAGPGARQQERTGCPLPSTAARAEGVLH